MDSRTFTILCVAGARPNFMKIGPILRALSESPHLSPKLVHTGQHYDDALSKIFFDELKIRQPDTDLGVGSGTHAVQTAEVMRRFEPVLDAEQPHVVLVVGDVNSTLACALVASKYTLHRPFAYKGASRRRPLVVHVEAGLRSRDDEMPEEINRRLTDSLSELLFVSDPDGLANLRAEGIPDERVFFVGNVMIDSLLAVRERAATSRILENIGVSPQQFGLLTLHRPSNVDDEAVLEELLRTLDEIAASVPIVFPVHPRTRARLAHLGLELDSRKWILIDPIGYIDFVRAMGAAAVVLTDSGGVQEETTVLGVPCITLRENTERPVTVSEGTNVLAGRSRERILRAYETAGERRQAGRIPRLWDGRAALRITEVLAGALGG